jgi:hypothetical protein
MQPGGQCQDFSGVQEVIENKTFHKRLARIWERGIGAKRTAHWMDVRMPTRGFSRWNRLVQGGTTER